MTKPGREAGRHRDTGGERSGLPFGLSLFLRGLTVGVLSTVFLGFQVGNYLNRRAVLVFNTGYGTVRVSREALEAIFTARCEGVDGVVAAEIRSRWRGDRTRIHLRLYLDSRAEVESAVAGVVASLYRTVSELTVASPVSVELVIEEIFLL